MRKALDHDLIIRRKVDPDELITLFKDNYGRNEKSVKFRHYETLRSLITYCLKNTFSIILGAYPAR